MNTNTSASPHATPSSFEPAGALPLADMATAMGTCGGGDPGPDPSYDPDPIPPDPDAE